MLKKLQNKKGFTLMEMLIVVAVIAILVAVAIPVYNAQMHKARVAADWANLRAYYAELQLDYLTRGAYNAEVPISDPDSGQTQQKDTSTIPFLNGDKVKLQAGVYWAIWKADSGYQLAYNCTSACFAEHTLSLGTWRLKQPCFIAAAAERT